MEILYAQAPQFQWAKKFGGIFNDQGNCIVLDASGNIYTAGYFKETADFDPGQATYNLSSYGVEDIFILKLDKSGNFVWAKRIGGSGIDVINSIVLDASGNIYATGAFQGTADFDPGVGTFNLSSAGLSDVFVLKLDSSGNFRWAKRVGKILDDFGWSIAVDQYENVYTTGQFQDTVDFDPGSGIFNLISLGKTEAYISKLDALGNFVWAKRLGSASEDAGSAIVIDTSGNIYATGIFQGIVDFDPGSGIFNLSSNGSYDIYILKLDSSGNFVWARQKGYFLTDVSQSIAVDMVGNIYLAGYMYRSSNDIFVAKVDAMGNSIWTKFMGGPSSEGADCVRIDKAGNVYTVGQFIATANFDPNFGFNLTAVGGGDIFISKLDSSGKFIWAKNIGGTGYETGYSIALDTLGNIYTAGFFGATVDFDPSPTSSFNLTSNGPFDIFIQKMHQTGVGINDYSTPMKTSSNKLKIYPNPNNGVFNVTISDNINNTQIEIYNSLGVLIYCYSIENEQNIISLIDLDKGIYLLRVLEGGSIMGFERFVKE